MRKGTVLSIKGLKIGSFISKNNILVILVALFIAGIAIGTFSYQKLNILAEYSDTYIQRFISQRFESSFFSVVLNSFMESMLMLLILFTFGTSMLGVILAPFSLLARGVLYGGVTALLYSDYSVKGIAFNAVLVLPSAIILISALLLASRESVKFSLIIARMSLPGSSSFNLSVDFKNYCGRYLFITMLVLVSALADAVLSCSFMGSLKL